MALILVVGRRLRHRRTQRRRGVDALCMIDYRARSGGSSRCFRPRLKRQKDGSASAARSSLHDDAGTFAAACGVSMESAGVVVLAPPHPSPDQHTIVARFPAALDGVAGAVEK